MERAIDYTITAKGLTYLALANAVMELEDDTTLSFRTIELVRRAFEAMKLEMGH